MSLVILAINDTGKMQVTWAVHWDTIHVFTLNLSWDIMYESVANKMTLAKFCKTEVALDIQNTNRSTELNPRPSDAADAL